MKIPWSPRLGVCSWSLRPRSPRELIDRVRECGLNAVQLALTPMVEDPATWGNAIDALRDARIAVLSGMLATVGEDYSSIARISETGGVRPDANWPATLDRAREVARIAGRHGLGLVSFHAGFLPHDAADPIRGTMLGRLAEIIDAFAEHGVRVAFETGQESAEALAACLEALAPRAAGVNFDPANMILYGSGDPIEAMRRLRASILSVHLKDARPSNQPGTWGREVPMGEGAVDWNGFFEEVAQCPSRPNLIIEREAGDNRVDDIRKATELACANVPIDREVL